MNIKKKKYKMDLKEHSITEYIKNIDFKNGNWSLQKIKEDMRKFLGEEPAIDVVYKKDVMINEDTNTATEVRNIDKINIIFTNLDNKFKKLEFLL